MLRLTDTRTRKVEDIVPANPGVLRMYACGPTVYRYAHVGNLRTFLLSDLIRRVAEYTGLRVDLVQNITDVGHMQDDQLDSGEDKLLAQARLEGKDPFALARFYEEQFHRDQAAIGVKPADRYPRASECIDLMHDMIRVLEDKSHAYVGTDGTVYFDARSFDTYGAISGNRLDQLRPGLRFTDPVEAGAKRFHADWALWKHAGPQREMVWDSPWGPGFPGWHIECSAMSVELLGATVDVHTGGIDLRFPHHEDERAQSDAAVGHEVVRHWVHGEHLLFEGRKMAKSTGNVVLVSDVEDRGYDPLALRLAFLQGHYRQQMNLTWDEIAAADKTLRRWRARVAAWAEFPSKPMSAQYAGRVVDAFSTDLDTAAAVIALRQLERDPEVAAGSKFETFAHLDRLFGLDLAREVGRPAAPMTLPPGAQDLLDRRAAARAARDFASSDSLRDQLAALDVAVTDTPQGQTWELVRPG
ncbi:MAG: cysteine--tRNA ligase [Actinomycetota bacterium]|nr:cysteine--tRNA ligase [Actinomycetota bacterium]